MKLKTIITCLAALSALSAGAKDYKYETVPGDLMKSRIYTLDNGLKVYLSVNKEQPRIQTYIAVRTGSRNDPAETTGLAHYLEHLMFKGTRQFGTSNMTAEAPLLDSIKARYEQYRHITDPAKRKVAYHQIDSISQLAARYNIPNEYDKLMASIGAKGTNAYTSNDVTCYTEDIPSNEVDNWARIQADRFQHMVIRGFHTELEAVYEEYNIGLARDMNKEYEALYAKLFPGHPYGTQTTIGTQEHLKNPSIVNIENYFHRYYVPNNVAICMAGDFNPDAVIATIDKYFGSWRRSNTLSRPEYAPLKPMTAVVDTTVVGQEAENVLLGWRFKASSDAQNDTLTLVNNILSNRQAGLMDIDLNQQMKCLYAQTLLDNLNDYSGLYLIGMPNAGQSLDDVRRLLLGEVEKLKKGEFSEDLVKAVVNNMKLDYYISLESNEQRANRFVDAFINGKSWKSVATQLDRIAGITRQQIIDFARTHFLDNYACVYKATGVDTTQKKIEKPAITAIPTNRDKQSDFVTEIINSHPAPIQPVFVDYKKDLTQGKAANGLPYIYVQNKDNGRFELSYHYDFGSEAGKWYADAAGYMDFIGTAKMNAAQLKSNFYKLACSYSFNVDDKSIDINLSGLNENLKAAVKLLEDFLTNARADKDSYAKYVGQVLKMREDNKLNQRANFSRLVYYGQYGSYNELRNVPDSAELTGKDPQELVALIKNLHNMPHTVLYYGPSTAQQLAAVMAVHKMPRKLTAAPAAKAYTLQQTPKNEILLAPYQAKNIYMRQYTNDGRRWSAAQQPLISLFNEYYGGGMNTVVFQELRESRGLAYNALAGYVVPSRTSEPEYAFAQIISQNDKLMDCLRVFGNIIDTIPQSQQAFDLARQALTKKIASNRTTRFDIIESYLKARDMGIDYDLNERIYKALPGLSLKDIVNFEHERMAHRPYRYMILGDESQLDIKDLEKIAPIRRISTREIFGY